MRYVAVRILQQWKNLKEYFLKFLPKKSNFKSTVANTDRYKRICAALQDPLAEAYTSVCTYSTSEVEDFLLQFQSYESRIHLLYSSICNLFQICNKSLFVKSCCLVRILKIFQLIIISRKTGKLCSLLTLE